MLRLIGDVHGKQGKYHKLLEKCEYSIQLGDLDLTYWHLDKLDPAKHRVLAGNHDNYDQLTSHFLGDFGEIEIDGLRLFFVRGGESIDRKYRQFKVSWWPNEQLTNTEAEDCLKYLDKVTADIYITHEAPSFIGKIFHERFPEFAADFTGTLDFLPSFTSKLLQEIYEKRPPLCWLFCHWHRDEVIETETTTFICLNELSTADLWKMNDEIIIRTNFHPLIKI